MKNEQKIVFAITVFMVIVVGATVGYLIILDLSFIDALYMTIITISTVGYKEVAEMTETAKIFSIAVIIISVGTGGYLASLVVSFFSGGYMSEVWRRRKMEKAIDTLTNHYIICGAGETGAHIVRQFKQQGIPFVVIEDDDMVIEDLKELDVHYIYGDATHDDILEKARIHEAKGLVASLSKDADNVFVVLTAKQMNNNIQIVARAFNRRSHKKLKRAGANHTVSPNEIGGKKMANMLIRPSVTYFMDHIIETNDIALDLEEIFINEKSDLAEKKLKDCKIPEKTGLIVLAIFNKDKDEFEFNPDSNSVIHANDRIIVVGEFEKIEQLKELAKSRE